MTSSIQKLSVSSRVRFFRFSVKVVGVCSVLSSAKKINSILLILPCTVEFGRHTVKPLSHGSLGN